MLIGTGGALLPPLRFAMLVPVAVPYVRMAPAAASQKNSNKTISSGNVHTSTSARRRGQALRTRAEPVDDMARSSRCMQAADIVNQLALAS
jgi:hypothetical protein